MEKQVEYLYHFMPIHKFLDFILSKAITLSSLSYMEDRFDGISLEDIDNLIQSNAMSSFYQKDQFFSGITIKSSSITDTMKRINEFRSHSLCCCFYNPKEEEESIAMWKLYSQMDSVALKIPKQDLETYLSGDLNYSSAYPNGDVVSKNEKAKIYYDNVNYTNIFKELPITNTEQGFVKHNDFSYEKEYRILMINSEEEIEQWNEKTVEDIPDPTNENPQDLAKYDFIKYCINPKICKIELPLELLKESCFIASPFIDIWKLKNLKSILRELNFPVFIKPSLSLPKIFTDSTKCF